MTTPGNRIPLPLLLLGGALLGALLIPYLLMKAVVKNGKFSVRQQIFGMEDLLALSKELLAKHQEVNSITFVHMTPQEIQHEATLRGRIPEETRHIIVATIVNDGRPSRIIDAVLCTEVEESVLATLPVIIER